MDETRNLVISMAIDPVAECALRARAEEADKAECECDACGAVFEGEPAGRGLYVWFRGEEMRCEEPPLCAKCATAIGLTALALFSMEEEEG
ncbi:MAG TPA: hypothetical protein PKA58_01980 [Polyangium sp.]|jgi:hypothetical protein|nr:hypothetical protein [Polyangium sp.]